LQFLQQRTMADNSHNSQEEEVLACSFHRWYQDFLSVTFPSVVIALPEVFIEYLLADGINLPHQMTDDGSDSSGWGDGGSDLGSEVGGPNEYFFPDIMNAISCAITDLGGAVLPKLNWSAPRDAKWMYGTLRCETAREVLTLLKSSDFIAHDLCHGFDHCVSSNGSRNRSRPDVFYLVLREWRAINEANEFRCFVHDRHLRAVSQRHGSMFFPHLVDPQFTGKVLQSIIKFFSEYILQRFPLQRYVFDILVGKPPKHRVRLVDFSPWAPSTDPLLFDWEELDTLAAGEGDAPEFRVVQSETENRAKLEHYHSLPLEVAELGVKSPEEIEALCRRAEETIQAGSQDRV